MFHVPWSMFWSWLSQDKTKTNHFTPLNLTFAFQLETMIERGKQSCFRLNQGNKCFIWRQSRYLLEILTYRCYLNLPRAGHLFHWSENESEAELGPAWAWSVRHTSSGPGHTYFQTENFSRYLQMIVFSQFSGGEQRQRAAWLAHCPTQSPPEMHAWNLFTVIS